MTKKLTMHQAEIKRLRSDARKLETVARHLRDDARRLAREEKLEQARVGFFAKESKIDPSLILEPIPAVFEEDEE